MLQAEATVVDRLMYQGKQALILDQSPFYPEGGGQPGDQGLIMAPTGTLKVTDTRRVEGRVYHLGALEGEIKTGDKVLLEVDTASRAQNSRCHSAGHLVSAVLEQISPGQEPVRAVHTKKAFIEYKGDILKAIPKDFAAMLTEALKKDAKVTLKTVSYAEIRNCPFIPKNPPKNDRPWRIMQIEDMVGIPCGGTHVKSLAEIGPITVQDILIKDGNTRIYYGVQ